MKTFKFADTSVFLHDQDLPDLLDYKDEIELIQKPPDSTFKRQIMPHTNRDF